MEGPASGGAFGGAAMSSGGVGVEAPTAGTGMPNTGAETTPNLGSGGAGAEAGAMDLAGVDADASPAGGDVDMATGGAAGTAGPIPGLAPAEGGLAGKAGERREHESAMQPEA